jgi:hypothetical protein
MRPKFNTTMKTSINESLIAVKVIDAHREDGVVLCRMKKDPPGGGRGGREDEIRAPLENFRKLC